MDKTLIQNWRQFLLYHIDLLSYDINNLYRGVINIIPKKRIEINNTYYPIFQILEWCTPYISNAKSSERLYHVRYNLWEKPICPVCHSTLKFNQYNKGYFKTCSIKCKSKNKNMWKKIKNTNLERYGAENPFANKDIQQKIKETNLERYGVEYPIQNKDIQQKIKETNLEKYGVEYPLQNETVFDKFKNTNLERYGTEYPMQNENINKKRIKSQLKSLYRKLISINRFTDHYIPLFDINAYTGLKDYHKWKCTKCNTTFSYRVMNACIPRCPKCYPINISTGEKEIYKFLLENDIPPNDIKTSVRGIPNIRELDLLIGNTSIEFNGLYCHSEKNGKDKYYHVNKTLQCLQNNINLIHIFEDEWIHKRDIIENIILNKIQKTPNKIGARQLKTTEVDNKFAEAFYNENHIQGHISGTHYGLYKDNTLYSLLTFGKSRFSNKHQYELYRFCSIKYMSVMGGLSKLINMLFKYNNIDSLITYADLRFGIGSAYHKVGFKYKGITEPNYYYTKDYKTRINRMQFQKHKLQNKLSYFDPSLTEWENMQLNGYDRIWDCGNAIYII